MTYYNNYGYPVPDENELFLPTRNTKSKWHKQKTHGLPMRTPMEDLAGRSLVG